MSDATDRTGMTHQPDFAAYLSLGWSHVPLHDMRDGRCSCDKAECRSQGKHPRLSKWQLPNQLVRSAMTLASYRRVTGNFGVATGSPSGVWVLDIDLSGMTAYTAWVEQYGNDWHQTLSAVTGSGGIHLYFALPDDGGAPITNVSKRKRREGVMPPGIDVRGDGGQAVLPPSASIKGAYAWLNWGAPILSAPAWLLSLVRETPEDDRPATPEASSGSPLWPVAASSTPGEVTSRGRAYAESAVRALVAELTHAPVGMRNDTAFAVACRLVELVNASWSGLDQWQTYEAWWVAASAHPEGIHVPESELLAAWKSAERRVAGAAAELPETWLQGEVIPFSSAPLAYGSPTGHEGADTRVKLPEGNLTVPTLDEWLASPSTSAQIAVEMGKLAVREEARRRLSAATGGTLAERVAKMRGTLLDRAGLLALPSPRWLVPDVLQRDSLARVVGQPGHGKSFAALDLAGALGSGLEWAGRKLDAAGVLYVVGEAVSENVARVRAWEAARGREMTGVSWYPEPVQAGDGAAWDALVVLAGELAGRAGEGGARGLGLIVIDTQARVTVGVNENDPTEMGRFIERCEQLRAATGACVLLVHHTPVGAERARGTGAVLGAMHTEILCRKDGREISLYLTKQKGAPDGDDGPQDLRFELAPAYEGGAPDGSGQIRTLVDPSEQVGVALRWIGERPRERRDAGRTKDGHVIMVTDDELLGKYVGRAAVIASMVLASPAAEVTKAEFAKMLAEQDAKGSDATWKRTWAELLSRRVIAQIRGTMRYRYIAPDDRAGLTEPRRGERDGAAGFYCE